MLTHTVKVGDQSYKRWRILPNRFRRPEPDHEPEVVAVYKAILGRKQGAILDVGVNKGQTMTKLLAIDRDRQYFGFEPQSMAAASVEGFLVDNQVQNFFVLPIALSDKNGALPMRIMGPGLLSMASAKASIVDGFWSEDRYGSTRYVYIARGDDVVEGLGLKAIALIKIDVEGSELEVVRGLQHSIGTYRPVITFEVLPPTIGGAIELNPENVDFRASRRRQLDAILRSKDYCIYQILGDDRYVKVAEINPQMMAERNFIAVPEEDDAYFSKLWSVQKA